MKAPPDILAEMEDDPPLRRWTRRRKWIAGLMLAGSFAILAGIFAWGAMNGTRSGRVWRLVDLHVRLAPPLTESAESIRDLPFVGSIQWRYVPVRRQWILDGKVDTDRMEDFLASQGGAASVARGAGGLAFTIQDSGVLSVGTMDAASGTVRMVTWVRREPPSAASRVIASRTPALRQLAENW